MIKKKIQQDKLFQDTIVEANLENRDIMEKNKMAISVNREGNPDGSIDLTIPVSTTQFFNEYWEIAIKDTGAKIFKENSQFGKKQMKDVLYELELIKGWAETNLTGRHLEYMTERVQNLLDNIPEAFDNEETILYIY